MGAVGCIGDSVGAIQNCEISVAPVVACNTIVLRQCDLCWDGGCAIGLVVVEPHLNALPIAHMVAKLANVELAGPRRHHRRSGRLCLHSNNYRQTRFGIWHLLAPRQTTKQICNCRAASPWALSWQGSFLNSTMRAPLWTDISTKTSVTLVPARA